MQTRLEASPAQILNNTTNEGQGYFQSAISRFKSFGKQTAELLYAHPKTTIGTLALLILFQDTASQAATQNPITKSRLFQDVFVLGNQPCDQIDLKEILGIYDYTNSKNPFACAETIQAFIARNCSTVDTFNRAIFSDKIDAVKMFIEAGADIKQKDSRDFSPLGTALLKQDKTLAKLLLKSGVRINQEIVYALPPLYWAITSQDEELVKLLIDAGADLDQKGMIGRTPLHEAIKTKRPEIIKIFIEAGANLNQKDNFYKTPLHEAIRTKRPEIIKMLIEAGADVNADPLVLCVAIDLKEVEIAKMLIEAGADVNKKVILRSNRRRVTPLSLAKSLGDVSLIDLLKEKGAIDTKTDA